ncbi:hypothetical protein BDR07DRAFT_1489556 [Suillus spraguei]|nr:hypothetical protein BDR07DRAFT_1489556 [Suillus spraguei]
MFSVLSLLALLVSSITGSPVEVRNSLITLPMTMRLTFSNEYSTHGPRADLPLLNFGMGYTVDVNIGSPPTTYRLVVESSSSITWVGTDNKYVSLTGVDTGKLVAVDYRYGGSFQGTIFEYLLTFTDELYIIGMPIAVASTPRGIVGFDGVLGIMLYSGQKTARLSQPWALTSLRFTTFSHVLRNSFGYHSHPPQ